MARTVLKGEPHVSGNTLYWSAVVDPGCFEAPSNIVDTVDCWRMTANDPAGLDVHAELVMQIELTAPMTMPGDSYDQSVALDELRSGYYHVVLSLDNEENGETYELHVRDEHGVLDLKSFHRTI